MVASMNRKYRIKFMKFRIFVCAATYSSSPMGRRPRNQDFTTVMCSRPSRTFVDDTSWLEQLRRRLSQFECVCSGGQGVHTVFVISLNVSIYYFCGSSLRALISTDNFRLFTIVEFFGARLVQSSFRFVKHEALDAPSHLTCTNHLTCTSFFLRTTWRAFKALCFLFQTWN
jgi:hypothetical protein